LPSPVFFACLGYLPSLCHAAVHPLLPLTSLLSLSSPDPYPLLHWSVRGFALKITAFWDTALCSLEVDWRFRGAYCLSHCFDDESSTCLRNVSIVTAVKTRYLTRVLLPWLASSRISIWFVKCGLIISLMMEAVCISETSVFCYKTT
jgi:hypothetical protein